MAKVDKKFKKDLEDKVKKGLKRHVKAQAEYEKYIWSKSK